MKVAAIKKMASVHGWKLFDEQPNIGMVSFKKTIGKSPARVNVYATKMTVATCLDHPKQGKTQLFRKNVDRSLLDKIFKNPRVHSPKGYKLNKHRKR